MIIRTLDPQRDLDRYLRVAHEADPFPRTPDEWRERQRMAPATAYRRYLVGELDDDVVAIGALLDNDLVAGGVAARVVVDRGHRRRGLGRAMAEAVEVLVAERRPAVVDVRVDDEDATSRAWAERRGFRLHTHSIRSRLDVPSFDEEAHRPAVEAARAAGYDFAAADDPDRLYDLFAALVRDVPDEYDTPTREWFRRQREELPHLVELVARRDGEWVGVALLHAAGSDGAWNSFTGVHREHRGHGVATALKVLAAAELRRLGRAWIETVNHAHNAPMLAVNRALGYRRTAGHVILRRT